MVFQHLMEWAIFDTLDNNRLVLAERNISILNLRLIARDLRVPLHELLSERTRRQKESYRRQIRESTQN